MHKRQLQKLSKETLIGLILQMAKLNKGNKSFLESQLTADFESLFAVSCKNIQKAFSSFEKLSLKDARRALVDFQKANPPPNLFVELCLTYIHAAYELEQSDWRIGEPFFSAIEKVYDLIFQAFKSNSILLKTYMPAVLELKNQANEGWCHRDYIEERLDEFS